MCSNPSWENLVQRKATDWSLPWFVLPDSFENMSVRALICHWRIMIAGTFKSCKVFETALQFSEWDKMCRLSITTEQVELLLRDPNPDYICREEKSQTSIVEIVRISLTAGSCELIHSSDVQAPVSGLCKESKRPKITISIFWKPVHVEFRPSANCKGL